MNKTKPVIPASASDPKASSVLAELRKLEAQATPGLWQISKIATGIDDEDGIVVADTYSVRVKAEQDAALIVALRNTALPLLTQQEEAMRVAQETLVTLTDIGMHRTFSCARLGTFEPECHRCVSAKALTEISAILDTTQEGK